MSTLFDITRNFSLYTIPIAWAFSIVPHLYAVRIYESSSKKSFDLTKPRAISSTLASDQTLDQGTKNRIQRAEGAQQNGMENIGLFAAAVVAGNVAGLSNGTLNALSGGYLASRVVYNLVYINNESNAVANVRTGVFFSGIIMIMTLFVKAGNAVRLAA